MREREDESGLFLRALEPSDSAQALAAHAELGQEDFEFLLGWSSQDWEGYLAELDREKRGIELPAGWVPSTFLVGVVPGHLVGRVSIRHRLNAKLTEVGGHIGYVTRPAFRGRGYATEMLRQALAVAREVGLDRVLLTCDDSNLTSAATIKRCGGRLESVLPARDGAPAKQRYWIEIA